MDVRGRSGWYLGPGLSHISGVSGITVLNLAMIFLFYWMMGIRFASLGSPKGPSNRWEHGAAPLGSLTGYIWGEKATHQG